MSTSAENMGSVPVRRRIAGVNTRSSAPFDLDWYMARSARLMKVSAVSSISHRQAGCAARLCAAGYRYRVEPAPDFAGIRRRSRAIAL